MPAQDPTPMPKPKLYARTNAEAHLYMELSPCACGETEFGGPSSVVDDAGVLCSRYAGTCAGCGAAREFVFELPAAFRPIGDTIEFGGSDPSRLLDPGEWMAVAVERARRQPGSRADLQFARAALEEVIKFLPAGAERVPDEAFTSERGRAIRDAEPGRFRRVRLAATLQAWSDILARPDRDSDRDPDPAPAPAPAPAPQSTPDDATELAAAALGQLAQLRELSLPVLVDALATAAVQRQGFEGIELRRHTADLAGQLHAVLRRFELTAAEQRQRTRTSAEVDRLLDAIARTDTEAGRAIAAHRADLAQLFAGIDLAQLSNSLQTLVAWLRDPRNASPASMQQLLAELQASVARTGGGDGNGRSS